MDCPPFIALDAFGTLVRIKNKRGSYRGILRAFCSSYADVSKDDFSRRVMTANMGLKDFLYTFAPNHVVQGTLPTDPESCALLRELNEELQVELDSVEMYPEVPRVLDTIQRCGAKMCVVSNLAQPYGEPVRRLLSPWIKDYVFSYEMGAVKPDPIMFHRACEIMGCTPPEAVMVGDNLERDIVGARAVGMQAWQVEHEGV